jgi:hypothetical protein
LSEKEVLDLPVDRFEAYAASAQRIEASERHDNVVDLVTSIGGTLTGKGIKEHMAKLEKATEGRD